jgi:UPF0755 protein
MRTRTVILTAAAALCAAAAVYHLAQPGAKVEFTVPAGASGKAIAAILKENGLILSADAFLALSDATGSTKRLNSGTYKLSRRASLFKILYDLRYGKTQDVKLTVPEGYDARQIASLIETRNLGDGVRFQQIVWKEKLEGFLFPETYFFSYGTGVEKIIEAMRKEFDRKYTAEFDARAKEIGMDRKQVVTLASIIEREAKDNSERGIISAVFHNRLRKKWMLESCATVRYALNKYEGKLTYRDLKVNSKYNTYRNYGLPPGPICNPGLESIKAALYPDPGSRDTMFFFSREGELHEFSKYYSQHLEAQKRLKQKR